MLCLPFYVIPFSVCKSGNPYGTLHQLRLQFVCKLTALYFHLLHYLIITVYAFFC